MNELTPEAKKYLDDIKAKFSKALEKPVMLADTSEATKKAFIEEVARLFPNSEVEFTAVGKGKIKAKVKIIQ